MIYGFRCKINKKLVAVIALLLIWPMIVLFTHSGIYVEFLYLTLIIVFYRGKKWFGDTYIALKNDWENIAYRLGNYLAVSFLLGIFFWIFKYIVQIFMYSVGNLVYDATLSWYINLDYIMKYVEIIMFTAVTQEVVFRDMIEKDTGGIKGTSLAAFLMMVFYSGYAVIGTGYMPGSAITSIIAVFIISFILSRTYKRGGLLFSVSFHSAIVFTISLLNIGIEWKDNIIIWLNDIPRLYSHSVIKDDVITLSSFIITGVITSYLLRILMEKYAGSDGTMKRFTINTKPKLRIFDHINIDKAVLYTKSLLIRELNRTEKTDVSNSSGLLNKGFHTAKKRFSVKNSIGHFTTVILIISVLVPAYTAVSLPSFVEIGEPVYMFNYTVESMRTISQEAVQINRITNPTYVFTDTDTINITGFDIYSTVVDSSLYRPDRINMNVEVLLNGSTGKILYKKDLGTFTAGQTSKYVLTMDDIISLTGYDPEKILPKNITTYDVNSINRTPLKYIEYIRVTYSVDERDPGYIQPLDTKCAVLINMDKETIISSEKVYYSGVMIRKS